MVLQLSSIKRLKRRWFQCSSSRSRTQNEAGGSPFRKAPYLPTRDARFRALLTLTCSYFQAQSRGTSFLSADSAAPQFHNCQTGTWHSQQPPLMGMSGVCNLSLFSNWRHQPPDGGSFGKCVICMWNKFLEGFKGTCSFNFDWNCLIYLQGVYRFYSFNINDWSWVSL